LAGSPVLLIIVDILLIVFTHIRTIQGVAALVRGHIEEDEIVRDDEVGARIVRACGCACGAAMIACALRCVDMCEVAMRKHRRILVTSAAGVLNALLGMVAVALFALGMYILAEVASAVLTVQALDGLGIIGAIVARDVVARHSERQGDRERARDQHADAARRRECVQSGAV
jgi:hypothetical protein